MDFHQIWYVHWYCGDLLWNCSLANFVNFDWVICPRHDNGGVLSFRVLFPKAIPKAIFTLYVFFRASESYGYYGLTFGIQNLAGDLYLNMFIVYLIEIPALFVCMYLMNRYITSWLNIIMFKISGLRHTKTCLCVDGNSEGPDQPTHPRSLIRAFAVRWQNHFTGRINGEQMPGWDFAHARNES